MLLATDDLPQFIGLEAQNEFKNSSYEESKALPFEIEGLEMRFSQISSWLG
jgi:hypothetical protein